MMTKICCHASCCSPTGLWWGDVGVSAWVMWLLHWEGTRRRRQEASARGGVTFRPGSARAGFASRPWPCSYHTYTQCHCQCDAHAPRAAHQARPQYTRTTPTTPTALGPRRVPNPSSAATPPRRASWPRPPLPRPSPSKASTSSRTPSTCPTPNCPSNWAPWPRTRPASRCTARPPWATRTRSWTAGRCRA